MKTSESDIQSAIPAFSDGTFTTQKAAAKAFNVPRSTFRSRLNGSRSQAIAQQYRQRLSFHQEESLTEWNLNEDARGSLPNHSRTREMVYEILRTNGDHEPLGKDWISSLLRRNSRVHSVLGRKLEFCRSNAAKPEEIKAFLDKFNQTCKDLNIKHSDILNMDETGIALRVCNNSKVIASSSKKKAYVKSPETPEWVSIIEAVSADGRKLR
ncbi:hypothetical protein K3495_g2191 [Podosphaera aphanis]|nr:hypothetical protein K3495_g2191 [Podosphaera aphanis]